MGTRNNKLWQLAALSIALLAVGCGDDDEAGPSGPILTIDSGTPSLDGSLQTPDAAVDAAAPSGECRGANGCYSCKPASNVQLLNACATGCVPFDNSKRLPGYQPGKLPPL